MNRSLVLLIIIGLASQVMPADAKIKRSQSAKVEFKQQHPCPANGARKGPCKGYVIDHIRHWPVVALTVHRICNGKRLLKRRQKTSGNAKAASCTLIKVFEYVHDRK